MQAEVVGEAAEQVGGGDDEDAAEQLGARVGGVAVADCTHADFSGCDFTSFRPGTPPPVLADAELSGAAIPGGNTWSGANMPGAVLAEAALTGCDLSGAATNLAGANLSGVGVTVFEPAYQGSGGIGGYNLGDGADQVIAFDYDSTPGSPDSTTWSATGPALTPAQEGAIPASLTSACLQAADFTGTHLGGASLTDAAITDTAGAIQVSHYDQYGNLTEPEPISWQNSRFPSDSSFTAATVCPNGSTYESNQQRHLSDAQMMQAQNPPTKWAPTNRVR